MVENIFPSVSSEIIDNSFTTIIADGSLDTISVLVTEKGEDNVLKYYAGNPSQLVKDLGEPNMRKYGQAQHNLLNWLTAGGGAWVLSVKGADAAYSNAVLSISTKVDAAAGEDKKKLYVKPTVRGLTEDMIDRSTMLAKMKTMPADTEEGYTAYPLIGMTPIGRSAAYDALGLRLECNRDLDQMYPNARVYNASVIEIVDGRESVVRGPFLVSLVDGIVNASRQSIFIEKVFKKYCPEMQITVNSAAFDAMATALGFDVDLMDITSNALQDMPGAVDFYKEAGYSTVNWVSTATNADPLLVTSDVNFHDFRNPARLRGGKTGVQDVASQNALKVKGYKGLIDPNILDINFYPCDIILDANEDISVKAAMSSLNEARRDHMTIVDCGITATPEQAVELRDNGLQMFNSRLAIFAQDMDVYDEYGQSDVRVTVTYDLARKLPVHFRDHGRHRPFVGPRRGGVGSHTNLGWVPTDPQKTMLYKRQINYIEKSPKRLNYATQLTSQTANSHMSNFSVVWTLLRMEKIAKEIADEFRMEFITDDTLGDLRRQISDALAPFVTNLAMESIEVSTAADDYDKSQKRARVAISVVPTSIMERLLITFNVNK